MKGDASDFDVARNRQDAAWLVGSVDTDYAAFWKPWPRAYRRARLSDERQSRLAAALARTQIRFVDLRQDLESIAGTYRRLDGHWSRKGQAIVAGRVERELQSLPVR